MKRLGVDEERAAAICAKFRERYSAEGWKENQPYPGISEMLSRLKAAGRKLAVATSKPLSTAMQVLEYFGLAQYFDVICGSNPDGSNGEKRVIVERALAGLGVSEAEKPLAVMVGDREHDIIGGRKNGLACIGLNVGFGSREELTGAGAVYVAESAGELADYLLAAR